MQLTTLTHLKDTQLKEKIKSIKGIESNAIADLVLHIAELDSRGLYIEWGYSSLFAYLTQELKYSEGAAQRRIQAARCLKHHHEVYSKLFEGNLSLCAVAEIYKVKSTEARTELLSFSEGKSKREVERAVAIHLPVAVIARESVRVKRMVVAPTSQSSTNSLFEQRAPVSLVPKGRGEEDQETEALYSIRLEVDKEFMKLYAEVKACCGATKMSEVLRTTLRSYLTLHSPEIREERRRKRRERAQQARTERTNRFKPKTVDPKTEDLKTEPPCSPAKVTRHVPIARRDNIFSRDDCQCTYISSDGHRCTETSNLQIDHIRPWACGGGHETENLRLLCGAHNRYLAQKIFGEERVRRENDSPPPVALLSPLR